MKTTLTIRLPVRLARELKAKARAAKTNPTAILREAAAQYVKDGSTGALNSLQQHINARAGSWRGYCSGAELLRRTRR